MDLTIILDLISQNWAIVSGLLVSLLANVVVAAKLKSVKKLLITLVEVNADKKVTDKEKIRVYDDFALVAKDMLAVIKGITPWK